jgi:hypothetical protein
MTSPERVHALGRQLRDVHDDLRRRLRGARDGEAGERLLTHCLTACQALRRHHEAEDGVLFPLVAEADPGLAPVLAELRRDHALVVTVLAQVESALRRGADARHELDGLLAVVESHFAWEERRLAGALDAVRSDTAPERLLGTEGTGSTGVPPTPIPDVPGHGWRSADTERVSIDSDERMAAEVSRRLAAGAALEDVGRWLYAGPAARSPMTAIKALRAGSGVGLAECKDAIDQAIRDEDPGFFRRVNALRTALADAMELPDRAARSSPPRAP